MRRTLAIAALACAALTPSVGLAQPTGDDARAEALFNAAKQLRDGGHVAEACAMFAESRQLAPGVGITLHLADCYEKMGRVTDAVAAFHDAESAARAHGDAKRAEVAKARAAALEPKIAKLTVASPTGSHAGRQILRDG